MQGYIRVSAANNNVPLSFSLGKNSTDIPATPGPSK
jgi:hypothetical protein